MPNLRFQKSDAGRSQSKRPKQKKDCVVRAVALAFEIPYDTAYEAMAEEGRKSGCGTPKKAWQGWLNSRAMRVPFPAESGRPRMNLERFAAEHTTGRWVVQMAGHLVSVIDGVVHDDEMPKQLMCVYAAWKPYGNQNL
jgi:hypothetical protein